ncbi:MAG: helix-turn-helix domain-containing protein [Bacteroidota bacterium]
MDNSTKKKRNKTTDEAGTNFFGRQIRAAREEKGLTLDELALRTGLTKSFLSQVERGKSSPSLSSVRLIVQELNIPLVSLFENSIDNLSNIVVRKNKRKKFKLPDSILDFELLTPNLKRRMEIIRVVAPPSGKSEFMAHEGEEWGYVVKGRIRLKVGNDEFELEEGDTVYYSSEIPHQWVNETEDEVELLWVITPPSF